MDDYLRDLERRSGNDPAVRLQLELARIRAGIWLPPEERFLKDTAEIASNLTDASHATDFRPDDFSCDSELDVDISNSGDLSIHHMRIFTTREVNEPGSYVQHPFLVAITLIYPTLQGVIASHQCQEYFGVRNVAFSGNSAFAASPVLPMAEAISVIVHNFLNSTGKVAMSIADITKIANDIRLQSLLCGNCGKKILFSRAYDNTNWPMHLGRRQALWDFSGQVPATDSHDDMVGVTVIDPQDRMQVRCLACMSTAPI